MVIVALTDHPSRQDKGDNCHDGKIVSHGYVALFIVKISGAIGWSTSCTVLMRVATPLLSFASRRCLGRRQDHIRGAARELKKGFLYGRVSAEARLPSSLAIYFLIIT